MIVLAINWGNALIITLLGFLLVILMLILLVLVLLAFGKLMTPKVRIPKMSKDASMQPQGKNSGDAEFHEVNMPANTTAAIAMALHLYYAEVHDEESHVITIKKVEKSYSPWNSKIYGINNLVK